jgi:hypothetical protein
LKNTQGQGSGKAQALPLFLPAQGNSDSTLDLSLRVTLVTALDEHNHYDFGRIAGQFPDSFCFRKISSAKSRW